VSRLTEFFTPGKCLGVLSDRSCHVFPLQISLLEIVTGLVGSCQGILSDRSCQVYEDPFSTKHDKLACEEMWFVRPQINFYPRDAAMNIATSASSSSSVVTPSAPKRQDTRGPGALNEFSGVCSSILF